LLLLHNCHTDAAAWCDGTRATTREMKMPKKKIQQPLVKEIQNGKSVEEVIKEHFSEYELTPVAREELPDTIREIIRINNKNLQFAVRSTWEWSEVFSLNAENEFSWEYWGHSEEGTKYPMDEEAYSDSRILNEIVRSLYGIKEKAPKATLTEEEFVERNGEVCPYCKGTALIALDETNWEVVFTGCGECGATWGKTCRLVVTGFKGWRLGR